MNHFLLYLLAREIAPAIGGRRITGARLLVPLLVFDLDDRSGRRYLIVFLATPGPFLWLDDEDPLCGLGQGVMKRLDGCEIDAAVAPPNDRILRLPLAGSGEAKLLSIYLYGSSAKVRIETGDTVVESLDPEEAGTPLPHTFGRRLPFLADIDPVALASALASPPARSKSPDRAVLGLEKELFDVFCSGGDVDTRGMLDFRNRLLARDTSFSLVTGGRIGRVVPVPGTPPDGEFIAFGPHDNVSAACREVGGRLREIARQTIVSRASAPLRRRLQSRQDLLSRLRDEAAASAQFDVDRTEADILAAYQSRVPPGASVIELPDLYQEGKKRRIELDPTMPVREQVERRYRRAAKLERSRAAIEERLEVVVRETAALEKTLARVEGEKLAPALQRIDDAIARHGLRRQKRRATAETEKSYRRYDLDSGWFVLVGRSDKENDEITFRVARPDDIWMHAQQVAGSHIVLKCLGKPGNPSDSILEAAAGIAAHFSKAKHSKLVPVIYTRRKYVRKFRGARPGQVRCEREKTIFAEPRLPE